MKISMLASLSLLIFSPSVFANCLVADVGGSKKVYVETVRTGSTGSDLQVTSYQQISEVTLSKELPRFRATFKSDAEVKDIACISYSVGHETSDCINRTQHKVISKNSGKGLLSFWGSNLVYAVQGARVVARASNECSSAEALLGAYTLNIQLWR